MLTHGRMPARCSLAPIRTRIRSACHSLPAGLFGTVFLPFLGCCICVWSLRQKLDFHEFSDYTLQLESFRSRTNDSSFRSLMSRVFDAMDRNGDGFVTEVCDLTPCRAVAQPFMQCISCCCQASMGQGVTQAL